MRTVLHRVLTAVIGGVACLPAAATAQLQISRVSGTVVDAQHAPVAGARVILHDAIGSVARSATTASDGSFVLPDVAPGSYVLRAELAGTLLVAQPLVVRGALPIEVELQVGATLTESVVVRGDAGAGDAEHSWSLAGETVRRMPGALPSHRIQGAVGSLPGWATEDNGLLHTRRVDDGLLYVKDGIPIYERLDRLFGLPPNPVALSSLHVLDGYIPPEFGCKSGGVIEVRSESGVRSRWSGAIDGGGGSFATRYVSAVAAGPLGGAGGLMLTAGDERSSRFLDPVDPGGFHNDGRATTAGAQLTWRAAANLFTTSASGGRNVYDVPHDFHQEQAGQDQRQRTAQLLLAGTWQRSVSERTVWQVSTRTRAAPRDHRRAGGLVVLAQPAGRSDGDGLGEQRNEPDLRVQLRQSAQRHAFRRAAPRGDHDRGVVSPPPVARACALR